MHPPSEEQQLIINHIKQGKNVIVNAVAGSGKSTTIISLSRELPDRTIFQITYNSMLRHEMKEKIRDLELPNLTIHTFHSLAVKYYLDSAHTDTEIRHILYHDVPPRSAIPPIDILAIDEAQDMSLLYFHFIYKFIRDMGVQPPKQILVLGDHQQSLYEFKGADARFLTMADQIWSKVAAFCGQPFEQCALRTSYRITNPMANFVNQTMLGNDRMIAARDGEPVIYIRNSRYNIEKTVLYQIRQILEAGAKPSDIFILAGSIKGLNSHVRKLENILVENNIPCHIPTIEQDKLDERVISGKIVFSTFHTVKGRQRRYVFVVGFDHSYFQTVAFTLDPKECPNTLYVGCTRATDGLYLLEFDNYATDRPLEFLKMNHHEMNACDFIKFKGMPQIQYYVPHEKSQDSAKQDRRYLTPTKLIKFVPDAVLDEIAPIVERIFTKSTVQIGGEITIPHIIQTEYGFEDVSDLNGIAIPAMYYDEIQRRWQPNAPCQNVLFTMIEAAISEMRENEHSYLKNIVKNLPRTCETIDDYLYLANVYVSIQERLYFKLKQIKRTEYNWLTPQIVEQCRACLETAIGRECGNCTETTDETTCEVFTEEMIIHHSHEEAHAKIDQFLEPYFADSSLKFRFTAIVDLITTQTLWEIKCTTKITIDHQLQVIIYAWLWMVTGREPREFRILNIKTGELWEMRASLEDLTHIVVALLRGKYMKPQDKSDEEFMRDIAQIVDET